VKDSIRELGLSGITSYDKFIPKCYLYNNCQVRLSVLQGLLDVGKHKIGKGRIQYYTSSEPLADDMVFLVQSLGGVATKRERIDGEEEFRKEQVLRHSGNSFVVEITLPQSINPFLLHRNSGKFKSRGPSARLISSITYLGRRACQCIRVAADDHLYLTEGCVLTHNTFDDSVCIFDEAQNATLGQLKLFMTRLGENSKMIINGDPGQSDIPGPVALINVVDRLDMVEGVGIVHFKSDSIVRNPLIARILEKL
jgi:phosphate starvation-inducible PhoH-like protein